MYIYIYICTCVYIYIYIYMYIFEATCCFTFLMKFISCEIYFISEPRKLRLKKTHAFLGTKTDKKSV